TLVSSLVVTDTNNGSGSPINTCASVTSLAAGASADCTVDYTVTQADLDRGSLINSAHADGTVGVIPSPIHSPTARAESTAVAREALELTNTANVTSFSVVGSVITYTLELTNRGNVTLTSPTIVVASPGTCGAIAGPIAPGLSVSCTASHTVTQA